MYGRVEIRRKTGIGGQYTGSSLESPRTDKTEESDLEINTYSMRVFLNSASRPAHVVLKSCLLK